jgi:hypothetical protein
LLCARVSIGTLTFIHSLYTLFGTVLTFPSWNKAQALFASRKVKTGIRDSHKGEIEEFQKEIKKLEAEIEEAKVEMASKQVLVRR